MDNMNSYFAYCLSGFNRGIYYVKLVAAEKNKKEGRKKDKIASITV